MKSTRFYDQHADILASRYDILDADVVNEAWSPLLADRTPGLACDIGAGSGRDARWLASRGWEVMAVEPSAAMRAAGEETSRENAITWLDDAMPDLSQLRALSCRFDLILVAAVWQHVPPRDRERAFRILAELLRPGGRIVLTLRHGRDETENRERGFHAVDAEELRGFARDRALVSILEDRRGDAQRENLEWETVVFELPDDGTGSLALLRHIIVNDSKAASYKLALLRSLSRIAEAMPGAASNPSDEAVDLPLGLVGLLWLKQYKRLMLTHNLPAGAAANAGFAKEAFYQLGSWSDSDLHVGIELASDNARILTAALRDTCGVIRNMPARYITHPGAGKQVFDVERRQVRLPKGPLRIDTAYLWSFGSLRVPRNLWLTLGDFACWIEPVIVREWSTLLGRWRVSDFNAPAMELFEWEEPARFTRLAHDRLDALKLSGIDTRCVWSARKSQHMQIDHCFPFARWPNNDLWNLLPASAQINREKSDRLPTIASLENARPRIADWWKYAYLDTGLRQRFYDEANLALPGSAPSAKQTNADAIFDAMIRQRIRIKANLRLMDWHPRS